MASFARLYDTINEKEWFLRLKPEERCVYLQLLAYSTKDRGCLHTSNSWVLSQKLMVEEQIVSRTIEKLVEIGRVEKSGDKLIICDYSEYNPDPTNAKRQEEFRLRNKDKANPVTKVTIVTESNVSNDKNAPEPEPEPEPEPDNYIQAISEVVENWNRMATDLGYSTIRKKLTEERKRKLKARLKEPEFKIQEIIKAFYEFKPKTPPSRDFPNGWKPDFDFVIRSETTYTQILEGKFSTNGNSNNKPSDDWINKPETRIRPEEAKF